MRIRHVRFALSNVHAHGIALIYIRASPCARPMATSHRRPSYTHYKSVCTLASREEASNRVSTYRQFRMMADRCWDLLDTYMLLVFLPLFLYLWSHALAGYVLVFSLNDIMFLGVQKV